jgi:hypothetical protein
MKHIHKIGAVFYALWALLHVVAGASLVFSALTDIDGHLREVGTAAAPSQLPSFGEHTVVSAIAAFHSFNMVWIGVLVFVTALTLNWQNSRGGFWLNLGVAGFLDLGLLVFLLVPGYMAWSDAWPGPLLFAAGATCSALGLRRPTSSARTDGALAGAC